MAVMPLVVQGQPSLQFCFVLLYIHAWTNQRDFTLMTANQHYTHIDNLVDMCCGPDARLIGQLCMHACRAITVGDRQAL